MYWQSFVHSLLWGSWWGFVKLTGTRSRSGLVQWIRYWSDPPTNPLSALSLDVCFMRLDQFWYALVLVCHWGIDTLYAYAQFYSVSELKICVVDIDSDSDSIFVSFRVLYSCSEFVFSAKTLLVFPKVWLSGLRSFFAEFLSRWCLHSRAHSSTSRSWMAQTSHFGRNWFIMC